MSSLAPAGRGTVRHSIGSLPGNISRKGFLMVRSLWRKWRALQAWQKWLLAVAVIAALMVIVWVAVNLIRTGQPPDWTGFGPDFGPNTSTSLPTHININQPAKTFWDWMQLLIVPAVLAVGAYLFNRSAAKRDAESRTARRDCPPDRRRPPDGFGDGGIPGSYVAALARRTASRTEPTDDAGNPAILQDKCPNCYAT